MELDKGLQTWLDDQECQVWLGYSKEDWYHTQFRGIMYIFDTYFDTYKHI